MMSHSGAHSDNQETDSTVPISSDDEGLVDEESTSFVNVLRYLLQGAQSSALFRGAERASRAADGDDSSDSSDDDTHVYLFDGRRNIQTRPPKPPEKPDTSVIDNSEFKQQLMYEAGQINPLNRRHLLAITSIPGMQCMREVGLLSSRYTMSPGQRAMASAAFLPNNFEPKKILKSRDKFFCGVFNKEGDLFMSACQDCKLRIFDTSNGGWKQLKEITCKDVGWSVLDVDFSHGGNHVIYSSWSEYIHICNVRGQQESHNALYLEPGTQNRTGVFSLRFNADDSEIVAGTNNGFIYIYNREVSKRTLKFDAHDDDLSSVCFADSSGQIFYSGGEDGIVKIWDRRSLREETPVPVGQLSGHHDSITHIDSKNDARYLITNSKDQSIKLWDVRKLATDEGIKATRSAVAKQDWDYRWHPYVGKVVKKKLAGDCSLMTYYGHSVIRTLIRCRFSPAFSTGQRYIYTGDGMGRVLIYDVLTGKVERCLQAKTIPVAGPGHRNEVVRDVSWHPYENVIVSSGWDGALYKWQWGSGDMQ